MAKEQGTKIYSNSVEMPLPTGKTESTVSGNENRGNENKKTAGQPEGGDKSPLSKKAALPAHLQSLIDKARNKGKSIKTTSQIRAEQEVKVQSRDTVRPILEDLVPKLVELSAEAWQKDNVTAQRERKELLEVLKEFPNLPENVGGVYNLIAFADAVVTALEPNYHSIKNIGISLLADIHFVVPVGISSKNNRKTFWLYGQEFFLDERISPEVRNYQNLADEVIDKLYRKVKTSTEHFEKEEKARLVEMQNRVDNSFTLADLRSGKKGELVLFTPNRTVVLPPRDDEPAKTIVYKGGYVLVRSNGETVEPVETVGACERWMKKLIDSGITVPVEMIFKERVSVSGNQDRNRRTLHSALYAGVKILQEKIQKEEERRKEIGDLRAKQQNDRDSFRSSKQPTISEVEFYLDEKPGGCFLDYGDRWFDQRLGWDKEKNRPKTRRFYTIVAYLERNEDGQVVVTDCPARLADLFAEFREPKPAGENYSGLGHLGFLIRDVRSRVVRGLSEEEKQIRGLVQKTVEVVEEQKAEGKSEVIKTDFIFAQTMMEGAGEDPVTVAVLPGPEETNED